MNEAAEKIINNQIPQMNNIKRDLTGQRFGRWTVLNGYETNAKGERKWLCRCDCGTERYVLERSLLYGGSRSCGCLRIERAHEASALELTGKTFGELTVIKAVPEHDKNGGIQWLCQCSCGEKCIISGTLLVNGKRTHCHNHRKNYYTKDITGQRFHRLIALYPVQKDNIRGVTWHCRCDCGNEIDVPYNNLVYGNMKSCGCQKKEHSQKLSGYLTHVGGTSIDAIRNRKIPVNNTTGCRGVYKIHGKYTAKIVFRKKQYYLGAYSNMENAVAARKKAESLLLDEVVSYYDRWKIKADSDPEWAALNPIHFNVFKDETDTLHVSMIPNLADDK